MKIGFLLNTCEPFYRGGYERRTWTFARELARQGHEIWIYTSCPRDETIEGVRFVRVAVPRPYFNARGVRNGGADLLFALRAGRLARRLREDRLDVLDVCATPFLHLPLAARAARRSGVPAILTCHEALLGALPAYARERGQGALTAAFTVRILSAIYRAGMSAFARRIAVSPRTAAALAAEGFPATATVEFGLEAEAFSPTPPSPRGAGEPVRLVSCGRLTPIKAVDRALAAVMALRETTARPFRFDIVGEGSERARLQAMVVAVGAGDRVTFHGEVSEAAKRTLFAQADVMVLASPREGFSIATLEAMAQGCAALVVNDPARANGVLDFVRDGQEGVVVAPGMGPLREGLRRLIENAEERERLRHRAWQTARHYEAGEQTRRLLAVYQAAIY